MNQKRKQPTRVIYNPAGPDPRTGKIDDARMKEYKFQQSAAGKRCMNHLATMAANIQAQTGIPVEVQGLKAMYRYDQKNQCITGISAIYDERITPERK